MRYRANSSHDSCDRALNEYVGFVFGEDVAKLFFHIHDDGSAPIIDGLFQRLTGDKEERSAHRFVSHGIDIILCPYYPLNALSGRPAPTTDIELSCIVLISDFQTDLCGKRKI